MCAWYGNTLEAEITLCNIRTLGKKVRFGQAFLKKKKISHFDWLLNSVYRRKTYQDLNKAFNMRHIDIM